jgi:electron transfer flavoprotein beta subunit
MNIAVLIKQTFDTEAGITLDEGGRVNGDGIKKIMNPFDEFAVEEAVRIKEQRGGGVCVFSAGDADAEDILRQALAMGADEAVLLNDPAFKSDDASTRAAALAACLRRRSFDLLLSGWTSVDAGEAQTAARVAELLDMPLVCLVTQIKLLEEKVEARCESDDGDLIVEVPLPAMLTVQKGINEPRYPSFKGIMRAGKLPLVKEDAAGEGMNNADYAPKLEVTRYELPARHTCAMLTGGVEEICRKLVNELRQSGRF